MQCICNVFLVSTLCLNKVIIIIIIIIIIGIIYHILYKHTKTY